MYCIVLTPLQPVPNFDKRGKKQKKKVGELCHIFPPIIPPAPAALISQTPH